MNSSGVNLVQRGFDARITLLVLARLARLPLVPSAAEKLEDDSTLPLLEALRRNLGA
jgi:hypothetical protein